MAVNKLMTLKEAVSKYVKDGDTIYYGGFQIMVPMAITHEIIRQKKKNLTTVESSTDVGGMRQGDSFGLDYELVCKSPLCSSPGLPVEDDQKV